MAAMLHNVICRRRPWAHTPVIHAASHFYDEKRVAWVSISMHACDSAPIVMGLYLTALWACWSSAMNSLHKHKLSETFYWYQEDLETAQGYRQHTFIWGRGINYTAPSFQKEAGTFGGVIILLITSSRNIITSTTESCYSLYSPAAATKKLGVASPITTEKARLWILVEWNPLINAK